MSDDKIDPDQVRRYAWSLSADLSDPEPEPAPKPPADPGALERGRREAKEGCQQLADAVARVWALGPGAAQLAALPSIIERAERLGLLAVAMRPHRVEAIRLGRLLARWWRHLPPELVQQAALALTWMDLGGHRESVDLLCEAARCESSWVAFGVSRSVLSPGVARRLPQLGARLAEILDQATDITVRACVARWLAVDHWPESVPALRRALLAPSLAVRVPALEALLGPDPPLITTEEVQALLDDAVVHPPLPSHRMKDEEAFGVGMEYETLLVKAVAVRRPPDGIAPLVRILDGQAVFIDGDREFLDDDFARRALAAGYPERALPEVDRALGAGKQFTRGHAVQAVAELPEAFARPRLLLAAADPALWVADQARKVWGERFGGLCPVPADAGLCPALLPVRRTAAFDGRLLVLRTGTAEARKAMMAALLAEAPDPEALALLIYTSADDHLVILEHGQPGVPRGARQWRETLVSTFGPAAWDGLVWLAARFPWGMESWITELHDPRMKERLPPATAATLREIAAARVASDQLREYDCGWLWVLEYLGAPESLLDRLVDLAAGRVLRVGTYIADQAGRVLGTYQGSPGLADRLRSALAEARATGDLGIFERLAAAGLAAGAEGVIEDAVAWLESPELPLGSGPWPAWSSLAEGLLREGRLPPSYVDDALARPGSPQFIVAASIPTREELAAGGPRREALERAVDAPEGAAAATAACCLLIDGLLAADDPRLPGILDRAAPVYRARLVDRLLMQEVPLEGIRPHVESVLTGDDEPAALALLETLEVNQPEGYRELLVEIYPRLQSAALRLAVEDECGLPSEAERYWQDPLANDEG